MSGPIKIEVHFQVVDESDDWIVLNKPAPLSVHPTSKKVEPTLLGGVEQLLSYEIANGARLSIMNRLDRETSGLVLIAKNKSAARMFGRAMERRLIQKEYDALCYGWPEWEEVIESGSILRKGEVTESPIWVKQMVHPNGRPCETRFKVVERKLIDGVKIARLRAFPKTGRMHQIRVHAAEVGHSLVGDKMYGPSEQCYLNYIENQLSEEMERQLMLDRQALHAARMRLEIDAIEYDWCVDIAGDLQEFFGALEK